MEWKACDFIRTDHSATLPSILVIRHISGEGGWGRKGEEKSTFFPKRGSPTKIGDFSFLQEQLTKNFQKLFPKNAKDDVFWRYLENFTNRALHNLARPRYTFACYGNSNVSFHRHGGIWGNTPARPTRRVLFLAARDCILAPQNHKKMTLVSKVVEKNLFFV